ncbi:glycosyltransferase [Belliella pelovolcani]|uniref:glycosyltransferase n=1 Tax=Belliella pelovolcani TaxID=529505 RepID=UPI0039193569
MIPKVIHYCWFGDKRFGETERNCIQSWKKALPNYQIKCWNESNFNFSDYEFARIAYINRKFAFVSDVCRLHVLYNEGGIYLDTDMFVLKSFDELLTQDFFIGEEKPSVINGAIIGSKPQIPIVKKMLEHYSSLAFKIEKPQAIPTILNQFLVNQNSVLILPSKYFYSLPYESRNRNYKEFVTKESISVHLWNHSWKSEFGYLSEGKYFKSLNVFFRNIKYNPKIFLQVKYLLKYSKFFLARLFPALVRKK